MRRKFDLSVYFVADPSLCSGRDLNDVVRGAVAGGVTMVQLRSKRGTSLEFLEQARMLRKLLNIPFLINDRVDIAQDVGADGVHLGQGDMYAAEARRILGPDKIIGVTAFTREHFAAIDPDAVDYAGTGPFYATKTEKGKPVLGPEGFRALVKISPVPVVGIGGITPANAAAVIENGAAGVAMMRSISEAPEPKKAAYAFTSTVATARLRKAS
ncbi:MAG: thiamine phosphate synthase [Alphaproteobacteria bacterium PRO2]|nr:thiamine phosphate synthase [Alphaproteobacteria bacterium PRO2]